MNDLLTARQVAEVDAYIHSPKHRAWERACKTRTTESRRTQSQNDCRLRAKDRVIGH